MMRPAVFVGRGDTLETQTLLCVPDACRKEVGTPTLRVVSLLDFPQSRPVFRVGLKTKRARISAGPECNITVVGLVFRGTELILK